MRFHIPFGALFKHLCMVTISLFAKTHTVFSCGQIPITRDQFTDRGKQLKSYFVFQYKCGKTRHKKNTLETGKGPIEWAPTDFINCLLLYGRDQLTDQVLSPNWVPLKSQFSFPDSVAWKKSRKHKAHFINCMVWIGPIDWPRSTFTQFHFLDSVKSGAKREIRKSQWGPIKMEF